MNRTSAVVLVLVLGATRAAADSYDDAPPELREVRSGTGAFLLQIAPVVTARAPPAAPVASGTTVSYEQRAKVTARATVKAGQLQALALQTRKGEAPVAVLRLFKGFERTPRWEVELDWLPESAVVSDSGRWVATFNRCHVTGECPRMVVLFDSKGRQARALGLADVFADSELLGLPRSTSSIWWATGMLRGAVPHTFTPDEKYLVLQVQLAGTSRPDVPEPGGTVRRVELASGEVVR